MLYSLIQSQDIEIALPPTIPHENNKPLYLSAGKCSFSKETMNQKLFVTMPQ